MNKPLTAKAQPVDIDALLQDTWLQVISLRQGIICQNGEGKTFWQRCVIDIELVQRALKEADFSEQSCQQIMYAQCALLDETVKGRGVEDDVYYAWCDSPLQAHFFNTLDAGNQLYERMCTVLREPAPDIAVLTCFHRVLMLGFQGGYSSLVVTERQQLVEQLTNLVPPFTFAPSQSILSVAPSQNRIIQWFQYWAVRLGLSLVVVVLLWYSLDYWLDDLLTTLLSGTL